ncbi:Transcription termination factor 3, mitochondrial [Fragariocoptes setiger]|uniref:Transcription termination factor 3, mitochondrial n=1 Tax=Fragariocoptes setiger TaxID=1670756 RepID=A0ABQ7S8P5_9ACAR|nr:Transcription termination factor 3, mitochondrial [Fragariocoptes setiger]
MTYRISSLLRFGPRPSINVVFNGPGRSLIKNNTRSTLSERLNHRNHQPNQLEIPEHITNPQSADFLESLRPPMGRSFNLAAYVNHSDTLKALVALRVSLYDIEKIGMSNAQYILGLDFQKDCIKHIQFLVDNGLKPDNLGRFITENPLIFSVSLEDLEIRLNYLQSKGFTPKMIAVILNKSPLFLTMNTKTIDHKLALLKLEFGLRDDKLRHMVVRDPYCVLQPHGQYIVTKFALLEEFGFRKCEIHRILPRVPEILEIPRWALHKTFSLLHQEIGLSHEMISRFPKLFVSPRNDMQSRFRFLKKLNRHQFDPQQPLYVPPSALYELDDEEFCEKYAKTSYENYRAFLKTI